MKGIVLSASSDDSIQAREAFLGSMNPEERMLAVLKRELYEGSWNEMIADLEARLQGKPYIFKLANRIEDDLKRIERLRDFEERFTVDISDFVSMDS